MELTQEERDHLPGWLLKLLDSDDAFEIGYAERHCSDRRNIRLLAARRIELEEARPTTWQPCRGCRNYFDAKPDQDFCPACVAVNIGAGT